LRFWLLLLFLLVFILVVEFLDPTLDAAQMEGLMTLAAIPKSAPLVDRVMDR